MSESFRPSARIVAFTRSDPAEVEPASQTSRSFADALSECTSIFRSRPATRSPSPGLPARDRMTVTAIASLSVDAAGKRARAFQAAPRPVRRSWT